MTMGMWMGGAVGSWNQAAIAGHMSFHRKQSPLEMLKAWAEGAGREAGRQVGSDAVCGQEGWEQSAEAAPAAAAAVLRWRRCPSPCSPALTLAWLAQAGVVARWTIASASRSGSAAGGSNSRSVGRLAAADCGQGRGRPGVPTGRLGSRLPQASQHLPASVTSTSPSHAALVPGNLRRQERRRRRSRGGTPALPHRRQQPPTKLPGIG